MNLFKKALCIMMIACTLAHGDHHHHKGCSAKGQSTELLEAQQTKINTLRRKRHGRVCKQCITIDTYVVVFRCTTGEGSWVDQAKVNEQMDVLNETFQDSPFKFRLLSTNFEIDDTECKTWGDASKVGRKHRRGDYSALNIYIGGAGDGSFAYFPSDGGVAGNIHDGAFVDSETLPGSTDWYSNLGFTATHEVGHWLGLEHTFGNSETPCDLNDKGDFVADTPQSTGTEGCPEGRNSCPNLPGVDPIHNYMDYSSDICYNQFTRGQMDRMYWVWSLYRQQNEACSVGSKKFEIEVKADQAAPDSTTFTLKSTDGFFNWDLSGDANGVDFSLEALKINTFDLCIDASKDYVFTMLDSQGNGLSSPGYYTIRYDGQTLRGQTSNFGASQSTPFSGGGSNSPLPPTIQFSLSPIATPTAAPVPPTTAPIWDFEGNCENSPPDWHDSDGIEYDCAWYALDNNCAEIGDQFPTNGVTANEACCVCGGGKSKDNNNPVADPTPPPTKMPTRQPTPPPISPPTPPPTKMPTRQPTPSPQSAGGDCQDLIEGWHDSDGEAYTCAWYMLDNNCEEFGHEFPNFGFTAKEACCSCNGGTNDDTNPIAPTPAPVANECEDFPLAWHDSDGSDYTCAWYAQEADACSDFGDMLSNFGRTANEACCTCGGGRVWD